jgi:hypothetical protein
MGRFKRNSRKHKLKLSFSKKDIPPKVDVKHYTYATSNGYIKVKYDNRKTVNVIKKLFLSLKKRNMFGNFINSFCKIDKDLSSVSDNCIANNAYREYVYGGHTVLYVGNYLSIPTHTLCRGDEIFSTPLGNLVLVNTLLRMKPLIPYRGAGIAYSDIHEVFLKDAYIEKGITETKIPNEMVFSLRFGTVLAIVFYLVVIFFLYVFISPIASIIYTVFNMVVLASFIKICIN